MKTVLGSETSFQMLFSFFFFFLLYSEFSNFMCIFNQYFNLIKYLFNLIKYVMLTILT